MVTKTGTAQGGARDDVGGLARGGAGLLRLYAQDPSGVPPAVALSSSVVVGRESMPTGVCVPQHSVSRVHARFSVHNGTWVLSDLSSRNGTFVNGQRITRRPLVHGDRIRIGDAIFKFVAEHAEDYVAFAAAPTPADDDPFFELKGGLQVHRVIEVLRRIAPTPISVLVLGETGCGKELVARAVHRASGRTGRLCAINCTAIPSGLIESELFGAKRGAFTGATNDRAGVVRAAHGGTLLLDEIGDMPLDTQAKLLRVLETREVVPVGATHGEKVDLRVVCATHRDLRRLTAAGAFRGDLFARINGCAVELPPLRDRKEDIVPLTRHFAAAAGRPDAPLTFRFVESLLTYDWPFNVRELEAAVRHAVVMADGEALDGRHLPSDVSASATSVDAALPEAPESKPAPRPSTSPPTEELVALLTRHRGNVAAVARELGKDRAQVFRWLRYAKIDPAQFR
jgi:DNA-binding NtrC family response regulator